MRKPLIAGNWKMNKNRDESLEFVYRINQVLPSKSQIDTVICPQSALLRCMVKRQGDNLRIGAQNVHFEEKGAFTGELSPALIASLGANYVIIGHSERRMMYNETDDSVNKKIISSLKFNLLPIVCVGELLEEREQGLTEKVIVKQIQEAFKNIPESNLNDIVIAYEPVWAIGTGKTATKEIANETCGLIRNMIEKLYNKNASEAMRILYGGSVNTKNISELMAQEHIDGALVGGASLDAESFLELVNKSL